ncbi:MAG TPA: hypothetical protein VGD64_04580 [Acidisarcina sp.]
MAIKLGVENKKQVAIAAVLGALVLFLVIRMLISNFGSPSPAPVTSATTAPPATVQTVSTPVRTATTTTAGHPAVKAPHLGANLDPSLHFEVMRQAESLEYAGRGRNIFSATSAQLVSIPKVTRPVRPVAVAYVAPPPAPPPTIDLKFFGYSAQKGTRKAFLLHGEDVFIAAEGEVVDHRYRVVKISPFSIDLEDLPYHNTQTLPLIAN